MQTIRLLGSAFVEAPGGPPAARGGQRTRMAVLAVLALSRNRCVSRDRIMALLWPESETERARHQLRECVYRLREALADGAAAISAVGDELRLVPECIRCDVWDFEAAVERQDWEEADRCYSGPLLDGFFLADQPDFERWVDGERARLSEMFGRALEARATERGTRGDWLGAVELWRRRIAADPQNGRVALLLMKALDASGDRAGALKHARVHAALLDSELGAAPDPAVEAYAERLRREPGGRPTFGPLQVASAQPGEGEEMPAERLPTAPEMGTLRSPARQTGREALDHAVGATFPALRSRVRRLGAGAAVAAVGAISAFALWRGQGPPPPRTERAGAPQTPPLPAAIRLATLPPAQSRVAVLPFENLTGSSALSFFSDVVSEEILSGVLQAGLSVVDRAAVRIQMEATTGAPANLVPQLVEKHGATTIVTGSFTMRGDSLRVRAQVADARTGRVLYSLEPEVGPRSDPLVAIGRIRERLLGGLVSEGVARSVTVALRPPRYAAYLEFLRSERERGCDAARPILERAIALDSTYVDPYVRLLSCVDLQCRYRSVCVGAGSWDTYELLVSRLDRMREKLSSYDQLRVDFSRAVLKGEPEAVLRLAQQAYEVTHAPEWAFEVGYRALHQFRPRLAIEYLQRSDSSFFAEGFLGQFEALATAYHLLGDYDAELATVDRGRAAIPQEDWCEAYLRVYAGMRDRSRVLVIADSLFRTRRTSAEVLSVAGLVFRTTADLRFHDDRETSNQMTDRYITKLRQVAGPTPPAVWEATMAFLWSNRGRADSARVHIGRSRQAQQRRASGWGQEARWGVWAARWGDSTRARTVADSIAALDIKWNHGEKEYWRAAILAELGQREEALRLLRESWRLGYVQAGWHAAEALGGFRNYVPFQRLLQPERLEQ